MRRTALAAAVLVAGSLFTAAPAAHACAGPVCEAINTVCELVRGAPCVR